MLTVVALLGTACSSDDGKDAGAKKRDGSSSSSSTTTTVTFSGEDGEAFCAKLTAFNTTYTTAALDPATVPVAELSARWAEAIAALKGMETDASDEIASDVTVLRERVEQLQAPLAAAGYDPTKIPAADRARFQDEAAQQAQERLSAYGTQVCEGGAAK